MSKLNRRKFIQISSLAAANMAVLSSSGKTSIFVEKLPGEELTLKLLKAGFVSPPDCMKKIFTIAAILLFFGFSVKSHTLKLKHDTTLQINIPVLKAYCFVKTPVYSALRPEPVQMPNGYLRATDQSVPMPTHKIEFIFGGIKK